MKLLTRLIARDKRAEIIEIERQLQDLTDLVERFYVVLGSKNWIFPDYLNMMELTEVIDAETHTDAEQQLVRLYTRSLASDLFILRLRNVDGLGNRFHLVDRARKHHLAEEYNSCVLHIVAVMDGFVSDFQPENRKGLHARDPELMVAYDSIVGHHLGLTHVLKTFLKPIYKPIEKEVFDLYRHGVVHGTVLHYDNEVVSCKAWNILFALVDWARATTMAATPIEERPTFWESMRQLQTNQKVKEQIEKWSASRYSSGDQGFEDLEAFHRTKAFLDAWIDRNFGTIARFVSPLFASNKRHSQVAGEMRDMFDGFFLSGYEISEIDNTAPVVWIVTGTAIVNGKEGNFLCRWIRQNGTGGSAIDPEPGELRLANCSPGIWSQS